MKALALAACSVVLAGPSFAQASPPGQAGTSPPAAPSMESSATTMAPVAPGSTMMHEVPTPSVEKRTNAITNGTGSKLTGKGGN